MQVCLSWRLYLILKKINGDVTVVSIKKIKIQRVIR